VGAVRGVDAQPLRCTLTSLEFFDRIAACDPPVTRGQVRAMPARPL
jgi:hypothetical protein